MKAQAIADESTHADRFKTGVVLGPEAPWRAPEDVAVMKESVEHGGDGGGGAEELAQFRGVDSR
jgi:hypothetical protein